MREQIRPSLSPTEATAPLLPDVPAIATALATTPEYRTDLVVGPGVGFLLQRDTHPVGYLEIYEAGLVRLTTPTARIELTRQGPPTLEAEGVVFAHPEGASVLTLSLDGRATLHLNAPPAAPESTLAPVLPASDPILPTDMRTSLAGDPRTAETVAQDGGEPVATSEQERQERVQVTGRLGTEVRYRTTRSGTLIAAFPLAIKQDDDSTRWQEVRVFGDRAARLQSGQAPRRGQVIDVVGYIHHREVTGKDSTTRVVDEVYAVVVTPR